MSVTRRDVRDLITWARSVGWELLPDQTSGHFKLQWPGYPHPVSISQTPSDHRTLLNERAALERICGRKAPRKQSGRARFKPNRDAFDMDAALRDRRRP